MKRNKLIIAILFVILIGLLTIALSQIFLQEDLTTGEQNILVLAIDESEQRPGMGACDMAFIVHTNNSKIINYTPVYPGQLTHSSVQEPAEFQAQGAGQMLLLHDSFYWEDSQKDAQYAKEIVEQHTNQSIDAVVAVNTEAMDAIIQSAGEITIKGEVQNITALDLVRENDQLHGGNYTRGEAVKILIKGLAKAAKDPAKKSAMVNTATDQFSKGNIIMNPEGAFLKVLATKGFENLF